MAFQLIDAASDAGRANVFVPFAEIAALLRDRLSAGELDDLLRRLISTRGRIVQPGDLITAEWAMDVSTRLALLEQAGGGTGIVAGAINEKAAATLIEAWGFYAGLIKRGEFLPDTAGSDAMKASLAITGAIQDVVVAAAFAAGRAYLVSRPALVDLFGGMYDVQHDLAVLLRSSIPGTGDPVTRISFATVLNDLLEGSTTAATLALHPAVEQKDVEAVIAAQDRINGLIMNQIGQVVVGNVEVGYRTSTRGETLVLGDALPFGYVFRVTNKTNRSLRFQLKAAFLAPHQDWSTSARPSVQTLDLEPFDPARPTDPRSVQDIQVVVSTPPAAANGDVGRLELRALAPAPLRVEGADTVDLDVGTTGGPVQPSKIAFSALSPFLLSGSLTAAAENAPTTLRFDYRFSTTVAPSSRDFRFKLVATNPASDAQLFFVSFSPDAVDSTQSDDKNRVSTAFTVQDGVPGSVEVTIVPLPGANGKTLQFSAGLESVADSITDSKGPISLTVTS